MNRGMLATTVKGAFKIYLVPATRTRNALATVTGGWSDLVAQARQEHEARKHGDVLAEPQPQAEPAVAAPALTPPATKPREQQRSRSRRPIIPGPASDPPANGPGQDDAAAWREHVMEQSPSTPELAPAEVPRQLLCRRSSRPASQALRYGQIRRLVRCTSPPASSHTCCPRCVTSWQGTDRFGRSALFRGPHLAGDHTSQMVQIVRGPFGNRTQSFGAEG